MFNIGDEVIIPRVNNKVGKIIGTEIERTSNTEYYVIDAGGEVPYRFYEKDLLPFVKPICEKKSEKILLVEDGSVDIDKIEKELGITCIAYRQGSNKPEWL